MGRPRRYNKKRGQQYVPQRTLLEIKAELSKDSKRRLLFLARSLLVTCLYTVPPRRMIRDLVVEIDDEIDREALIGVEKESRGS